MPGTSPGPLSARDDEAAAALEVPRSRPWSARATPPRLRRSSGAAELTADEPRAPAGGCRPPRRRLHAGSCRGVVALLAEPLADADPRLTGRRAAPAGRGSTTSRASRRRDGDCCSRRRRCSRTSIGSARSRSCAEGCVSAADPRQQGARCSPPRSCARRSPPTRRTTRPSKRLASFTLGWVLCYVGRPAEGMPLLERAADVGRGPRRELDSLSCSAVGVRSTGSSDRARRSRRRPWRRPLAGAGRRSACCRTCSTSRPGTACGRASSTRAYAAASEALALAREIDLRLPQMQALLILTAATARRGVERSAAAMRTRSWRPDRGGRRARPSALWRLYSLGLLALALGHFDEAAGSSKLAARGLDELGIHSPSFVPRAELVEVYVRAGRPADESALARHVVRRSPRGQSPARHGRRRARPGTARRERPVRDALHDALAAHVRSRRPLVARRAPASLRRAPPARRTARRRARAAAVRPRGLRGDGRRGLGARARTSCGRAARSSGADRRGRTSS